MKNKLYSTKNVSDNHLRLRGTSLLLAIVLAFFLLSSSPAVAQNCNCAGTTLGAEIVVNPQIGNTTTFPNCYMNYTTNFAAGTCGGAGYGAGASTCVEAAGAGALLGTWVGAARSNPRCLIYDGPTNGDRVIWRQIIPVEPIKVYRVSAFFQSTCPTCTIQSTTIFIRVNGIMVPGTRRTVNAANSNPWTNVCGTFTSGNTKIDTVEIVVVTNPTASGNDGAIDDISIMEVLVNANASFTKSTPRCLLPVQFTSANPGTGFTHFWDFGDDSTSTSANPSHLYNGGGVFIVRHTVTNNCGSATFIDTVKITNCCDCNGCGKNLVFNGDFRKPCYTGYQSQLTPIACPHGSTKPGEYTEATDASKSFPAYWCGFDHTPGGETKFLIADGPYTMNTPGDRKAWIQKVPVQAGHTYCYTAYARNLCYAFPPTPSIYLQVIGSGISYVVAEADDIPYNPCCDAWIKICGTWTAPVGVDSVELSVVIKDGAWVGTDAGIDDISFSDIKGTPDADFDDTIVCDSVAFARVSTSGNSSWDFGDGGHSTLPNPTHKYAMAGTYWVTHILTNSCGSDTVKKLVEVAPCCCSPCNINLVYNGDFSSGCGVGYSSTLTLDPNCPNSTGSSPGIHTEDTDASTVESNWYGTDHTASVGSKILIMDYTFPTPTIDTGWSQTVPVIPGRKYCLTFYVKNLYAFSTPATSPMFGFSINTLQVYPPQLLPFDSSWKKVCVEWVAPVGITSANLGLMLFPSTAGIGCDLAVDDISFSEACEPQHSMALPSKGNSKEASAPAKNSISMNDQVKVYPVPLKKGEPLYVSYTAGTDAHMTLTVLDETGKQVATINENIKKGENIFTLKTTHLSPGVYYISFYPPNENGIQKMIVVE